ncbi:MAG: hypothetical protein WAN89_06600 [Lawsonella sp.]|nr:hypothetical protein [Mycobacteriales bacterium]
MHATRSRLGALFLAGAVLLSACTSPQERIDSLPLQDFLVTQQELPEGFTTTPIRGTELANATEGNLAAQPAHCAEPSKKWLDGSSEAVGTYLEYPAAEVVVALLLVRPAQDFAPIGDYLKQCRKHQRAGEGLRIKVELKDYPPPATAALSAMGYQERITLPKSAPVSSTYLYTTHSGISVIAILRSRQKTPSRGQISSLNSIFKGQIEKIDGVK